MTFTSNDDGTALFYELITFLDNHADDFGCFPGEQFADYVMPAFEMQYGKSYKIAIDELREDFQPLIRKWCPTFGEIEWQII